MTSLYVFPVHPNLLQLLRRDQHRPHDQGRDLTHPPPVFSFTKATSLLVFQTSSKNKHTHGFKWGSIHVFGHGSNPGRCKKVCTLPMSSHDKLMIRLRALDKMEMDGRTDGQTGVRTHQNICLSEAPRPQDVEPESPSH